MIAKGKNLLPDLYIANKPVEAATAETVALDLAVVLEMVETGVMVSIVVAAAGDEEVVRIVLVAMLSMALEEVLEDVEEEEVELLDELDELVEDVCVELVVLV